MKRVLVIDDDTTLQTLMRKVLERESFEVVTTKFGKEGVEYLKSNGFNVVVLDMGLPDADGLEILAEMRSIDSSIPIIIV
jgi:DNA-binding response OmpR family regulator